MDQRVNRRRVATYAADRKCLSAYCYTGAFDAHLAAAGATSVYGIDSSFPAISLARKNATLNTTSTEFEVIDVPTKLREYVQTEE
jgi:23S rRNA (cytosine1962-C5)-methyltransferase